MNIEKKYDLLIVISPKDFNKLKFLITSIKNLNPQPENICVVSPSEIKEKHEGVTYFLDDEVLKFNRLKIKHRPNWISQQLIKLFQNVTPNENYLVIDSDIFINKKINIFDGDRPNFFMTLDQTHKPYFKFLEYFGIQKLHSHSFISEIMFMNKNIIKNFLISKNYNIDLFIEKSIEIIDQNCYISEFELYGNLVLSNNPNLYNFKKINTKIFGKESEWLDQEIESLILLNKDLEIISYHTWT
jgi:hypothetical protein